MTHRTDIAIIGAGQAGLAMSACLGAAGIEHVVIERGRIGERWRSERWPSLRLLTPNWMTRLPGVAPRAGDPDGFMRAAAFARVLEAYALRIDAPLWSGTVVDRLAARGAGYLLSTSRGPLRARGVVIATGACDRPARPAGLGRDIAQLTPDRYRGPDALPPGGVLVVGASATGAQLAREIRRAGRDVMLSVGRHVRAPRRYRGRDLFAWLDESGFLSDLATPEANMARLRAQPSLQLAGSRREGEVGLPQLAAKGVRILSRAVAAEGATLRLDGTLPNECAAAEARRQTLLTRIDAHIAASRLDAPEERAAWRAPPPPHAGSDRLDLRAEGIRTVLWATGYRRAYPRLDLPILDEAGELPTRAGLTPAPGLFTLGLPFQRHRASAFIYGVGRDAEALLPAIALHLSAALPRAA